MKKVIVVGLFLSLAVSWGMGVYAREKLPEPQAKSAIVMVESIPPKAKVKYNFGFAHRIPPDNELIPTDIKVESIEAGKTPLVIRIKDIGYTYFEIEMSKKGYPIQLRRYDHIPEKVSFTLGADEGQYRGIAAKLKKKFPVFKIEDETIAKVLSGLSGQESIRISTISPLAEKRVNLNLKDVTLRDILNALITVEAQRKWTVEAGDIICIWSRGTATKKQIKKIKKSLRNKQGKRK